MFLGRMRSKMTDRDEPSGETNYCIFVAFQLQSYHRSEGAVHGYARSSISARRTKSTLTPNAPLLLRRPLPRERGPAVRLPVHSRPTGKNMNRAGSRGRTNSDRRALF